MKRIGRAWRWLRAWWLLLWHPRNPILDDIAHEQNIARRPGGLCSPSESDAELRERILANVRMRQFTMVTARALIEALDAHHLTEDEVQEQLPVGVTIDDVRRRLVESVTGAPRMRSA
jgi:hypothetical protein